MNGGDRQEHPAQALADLFAVESLCGPVSGLHIGISGDLRARTVRSLLQVLDTAGAKEVSLFAPPGRGLSSEDLPPDLRPRTRLRATPDFEGLDVLYLPGLAPQSGRHDLAADAHLRWGLSSVSAPALASDAIVLSPGPVIDEIEPGLIEDPRVRVFDQSDLSVAIRRAVLQWLLESEERQ